MNDEIVTQMCLNLLKVNIDLFMHGSIESKGSINKTFMKCLSESLELQQKLFQAMKNSGFYNAENTKQSNIDKVINKYNKTLAC